MNGTSREVMLRKIRMGLYGDAGRMNGRDAVLDNETLSKKVAEAEKRYSIINNNSLLEQLLEELSSVNSEVYRAQTEDEIRDYVLGLIHRKDIKSFTTWDSEYLSTLNLSNVLEGEGLSRIDSDDKYEIAEAGIGITGSDFAIADTGTLVLLSDGRKPRSVSLLPPVHLAIVREADIVSNIGELVVILKQKLDAEKMVPSCITFITGPSRTADIELNLTLGVHGPKELYVIVI